MTLIFGIDKLAGMPTATHDLAKSEALAGYEILDTPPEPFFDDIARLASQVCGIPMSLITLIDGDWQYLKSRVGFAASARPPLQN